MKILVISDTHRSQLYFYELLEKIKDIDYVIHCGDVEGCDDEMESICRVPFVAVAGNNLSEEGGHLKWIRPKSEVS